MVIKTLIAIAFSLFSQAESYSFLAFKDRVEITFNQPEVLYEKKYRTIKEGESHLDYIQSFINQAKSKTHTTHILPKEDYFLSTDKSIHLYISKLKDVVLDFSGSKLIFNSDAIGFWTGDNERIAVKNLTIDYGFYTTSIAKVKRSEKFLSLTPMKHFNDEISQNRFLQTIYSIHPSTGELTHPWTVNQEYEVFATTSDFTYDLNQKAFLKSSKRLINELVDGAYVILQHRKFRSNAFQIVRGEDLFFDNITFLSAPGAAFYAGDVKRGIRITNSKVVKKPAAAASVAADVIHFASVGGDVDINNNDFSAMGDDSVNIFTKFVDIYPKGVFTFGFNIKHPHHLSCISRAKNVTLYDKNLKITAESALVFNKENEFRIDAAVDGAYYAVFKECITRRISIRENKFHNHRGRGILLQGEDAEIIGNTFENITHQGVLFNADLKHFSEASPAKNVRVQSNTFINVGYKRAAIGTNALCRENEDKVLNNSLFQNIAINNNTFIGNKLIRMEFTKNLEM